jgi:dienelactone hydrolase
MFSRFIWALTAFAIAATVATGTGVFGQELTQPTGRLGAVMEYDPTQLQTVYRPRDLTSSAAAKVPVVVWGNGGCADNGGASARQFLMEVASHGYLVIAPGKPGPDVDVVPTTNRATEPPPAPALGAQQTPPTAGPGPGVDPTQSSQLIDGVTWAVRENSRPGSIYFKRLDPSKVAAMGHSCGGLQALDISNDPRIVTTVIWDSGIYVRPGGRSGVRITKNKLKELHAPIAYFNGGPTDSAFENSRDDYQKINQVPVFLGELPVGHGGTFRQVNGGAFAKVAVAWLNWRLKGDKAAGAMFSGPKCGLCVDPEWKVERKHME